jgi:hypothetical protein
MRSRHYISLVLGIAVVHAAAYLTSFAVAFAIGDSGRAVPPYLQVLEAVVGAPLMYLLYLPPSTFGPTRWWGDDTNFIIGLAIINSLIWGMALAAAIRCWRRSKQASPSAGATAGNDGQPP